MVLAKKREDFIDLREKPMNGEIATASPGRDHEEPRGPTLYVRDADLSITADDIGETFTAKIKFKPREVRVTEVNGKKSKSYDLEITGISL